MERIVQLLDDFDDLTAMVGLVSERIRRAIHGLLLTAAGLAIQAGGIKLAMSHPPLALAMAMLLFVSLLYRTVTNPHRPLEIA